MFFYLSHINRGCLVKKYGIGLLESEVSRQTTAEGVLLMGQIFSPCSFVLDGLQKCWGKNDIT